VIIEYVLSYTPPACAAVASDDKVLLFINVY